MGKHFDLPKELEGRIPHCHHCGKWLYDLEVTYKCCAPRQYRLVLCTEEGCTVHCICNS